ncbi:hypothetical protein ABEF92_003632 [Exophiala dermatitidis]|uniref:2-dehydropantoate 2-reductase n=1 Tax=Exophiala dermatitidis (strain ATCC 34100 / CBS 525.76 / NIH/UT8656) TaxID=858893 RepID=H6BKR2_EXODN|nr:2-dehydropantoate 2-reductase [Exophiala dermatitidis NIH/UT8656]EHY52696.1 2-dehydropantoate 2-reductase [Exophiala dermatitidis NIH/UT8656]
MATTNNDTKLDVCLVGVGGVGTITSYVLEKSGRARVTAVLRSNYHIVKDQGVDIDSVDHGEVRGFKPTHVVPSLSAAAKTVPNGYDFIVITTKALPDLVAAMIPDLKPLITEGKTSLVLIQNGLNIETPLAEAFPTTPILSAVSMIGSRNTSPRTIYHEDPDEMRLGPFYHHDKDPNSKPYLSHETQLDAAKRFTDLYNAGLVDAKPKTGAQCELVDDVVGARWRKLLWNGSFNTICTLLRISVGELLSSPGRDTLLEPAMREIAAIATAAGFGRNVSEEIIQTTLKGTPPTSPFRPSMLVDLEKGRPMELDVILGAPLKVARQYSVPTPVLTQVHELLRVVQWTLTQKKTQPQPQPHAQTNGHI